MKLIIVTLILEPLLAHMEVCLDSNFDLGFLHFSFCSIIFKFDFDFQMLHVFYFISKISLFEYLVSNLLSSFMVYSISLNLVLKNTTYEKAYRLDYFNCNTQFVSLFNTFMI